MVLVLVTLRGIVAYSRCCDGKHFVVRRCTGTCRQFDRHVMMCRLVIVCSGALLPSSLFSTGAG